MIGNPQDQRPQYSLGALLIVITLAACTLSFGRIFGFRAIAAISFVITQIVFALLVGAVWLVPVVAVVQWCTKSPNERRTDSFRGPDAHDPLQRP